MKYFSFFNMKMAFAIALVLVTTGAACGKRRLEPEVYIPEGMPVTVDVSRDDQVSERVNYIIRPQFGLDVDVVSLWLFTINTDGTMDSSSGQIKFIDIDKHAEIGSFSWNRTEDVGRFLVVVQTVKTLDGIWVPDIPIKQFPLNEIVTKGAAALPKAKFLKEDE